jgi:hypothetical protein
MSNNLLDKIGTFTVIPDTVVKMIPKLGFTAYTFYTYLRHRAGNKNGCYPSYETINRDIGMSSATIAKAVKVLIEHNLISVNKGSNGNNIYIIEYIKPDNYETVLQDMKGGSLECEVPVLQDVKLNKIQLTRCIKQDLSEPFGLNTIHQLADLTEHSQSLLEEGYNTMDIQEHKARTLQALENSFTRQSTYENLIYKLFKIHVNRRRKDWKELLLFLKETGKGEDMLTRFATWWYANDWRGKRGQSPNASQIMELLPQIELPQETVTVQYREF